jgi:hypothetical protein
VIEVMVKVAFALALLGFHPNGTEIKEPPGKALQVQQGIVAPPPSPSPVVSSQTSVPPAPIPHIGCLTAGEVASYASKAGFTASEVPVMVGFAARESGYCPGAINTSSGACGLWQLYPCPGPQALEPMANAWLAREKCLAAEAAGRGCFAPWGG